MSDEPSDYKQSDSFKRNYAGTFIEKPQVQENKPVESESEPSQREDDPLENMKCWFRLIRDPKNSTAIQAIFTVVIALTGILYTFFAYEQWNATQTAAKAAAKSADITAKQFEFV